MASRQEAVNRAYTTCTPTTTITVLFLCLSISSLWLRVSSAFLIENHQIQNSFRFRRSIFVPIRKPPTVVILPLSVKLQAKRGQRKGQGRGGRGGKKSKANDEAREQERQLNDKRKVSVPKPSSTRRVIISLDRMAMTTTKSSNGTTQDILRSARADQVHVCAYQVDDTSWWEHAQNTNPYGARLWPSAIGAAQFLARLGLFHESQHVLELGCGCGLVSLVAAQSGAKVVALDISTVALSLTAKGWQETQSMNKKDSDNNSSDNNNKHGDDHTAATRSSAQGKTGSLSTLNFDIFSSLPLPFASSSPLGGDLSSLSESTSTRLYPPIVVAAAMLYEADLAESLARRAFEACKLGAWFIIGDDDTGERENGRQRFEAELDRLQKMNGNAENKNNESLVIRRVWTATVVKYKALGWSEKQVKLLHLNPPLDLSLE